MGSTRDVVREAMQRVLARPVQDFCSYPEVGQDSDKLLAFLKQQRLALIWSRQQHMANGPQPAVSGHSTVTLRSVSDTAGQQVQEARAIVSGQLPHTLAAGDVPAQQPCASSPREAASKQSSTAVAGKPCSSPCGSGQEGDSVSGTQHQPAVKPAKQRPVQLDSNGQPCYKHVTWDATRKKYRAWCHTHNTKLHVGYYPTAETAARAADLALLDKPPRKASMDLNFPLSDYTPGSDSRRNIERQVHESLCTREKSKKLRDQQREQRASSPGNVTAATGAWTDSKAQHPQGTDRACDPGPGAGWAWTAGTTADPITEAVQAVIQRLGSAPPAHDEAADVQPTPQAVSEAPHEQRQPPHQPHPAAPHTQPPPPYVTTSSSLAPCTVHTSSNDCAHMRRMSSPRPHPTHSSLFPGQPPAHVTTAPGSRVTPVPRPESGPRSSTPDAQHIPVPPVTTPNLTQQLGLQIGESLRIPQADNVRSHAPHSDSPAQGHGAVRQQTAAHPAAPVPCDVHDEAVPSVLHSCATDLEVPLQAGGFRPLSSSSALHGPPDALGSAPPTQPQLSLDLLQPATCLPSLDLEGLLQHVTQQQPADLPTGAAHLISQGTAAGSPQCSRASASDLAVVDPQGVQPSTALSPAPQAAAAESDAVSALPDVEALFGLPDSQGADGGLASGGPSPAPQPTVPIAATQTALTAHDGLGHNINTRQPVQQLYAGMPILSSCVPATHQEDRAEQRSISEACQRAGDSRACYQHGASTPSSATVAAAQQHPAPEAVAPRHITACQAVRLPPQQPSQCAMPPLPATAVSPSPAQDCPSQQGSPQHQQPKRQPPAPHPTSTAPPRYAATTDCPAQLVRVDGWLGVWYHTGHDMYRAYSTQLRPDGSKHKVKIGEFASPEEAARAYDGFSLRAEGPSARTNYPLDEYSHILPLALPPPMPMHLAPLHAPGHVFPGMVEDWRSHKRARTVTSHGGHGGFDPVQQTHSKRAYREPSAGGMGYPRAALFGQCDFEQYN